jgi:phosphatidyl-myo-inositol dimannoside synthase
MAALLLTHGFPPDVGGIQTYLHARCLGTPEEIAVVAPERPGAGDFDREQPFPVYRWPVPLGLARPMQVVGPLLESRKTDEVEWIECGTVLPVGLPAYALARRLRKPYLVWTHGRELFIAQQPPWNVLGGTDRMMRFLLRNARAVMANSHATADVVQGFGVPQSRIHVLTPGVLPGSGERPDPSGPGLRERLGLGERPLVLSVSRLVPRKGQDLLLGAVARAREECPDLACVIVGEGTDRERLQAQVRELGLTEHAFLPGRVEDLAEAYSAATLFALLSRHVPERGWWEGFGIVYREAGQFGLPVVATRVGGIPDAVEDGETGFLVPQDDVEAAAAAIVRIVRDPELARRLGEAGRERAAMQPEWQTIRAVMTDRHSPP